MHGSVHHLPTYRMGAEVLLLLLAPHHHHHHHPTPLGMLAKEAFLHHPTIIIVVRPHHHHHHPFPHLVLQVGR